MLLLYGIDVGDASDLKVSFQLSIPSKTGSNSEGSSSDSSDTVIDTIEAQSIDAAINLANRIYK